MFYVKVINYEQQGMEFEYKSFKKPVEIHKATVTQQKHKT